MADETWDDIIAGAGDGFNLPPEDTYDFVITGAEAKISKRSGNPMIETQAKIANGPHAQKSIKKFYIVRSVDGARGFMKHMGAVGITIETLQQHKPTLEQIAKAIIGKPFRGKVKHVSSEEFGNSAELEWQMKPPTGGAEPITYFEPLSDAESLGYTDSTGVSTVDDAGF